MAKSKHRSKKVSPKSLKIQKTPMLQRGMRMSKVGKHHKLGFSAFIATLFQLNESLPRSKKMTDAEIARQIYREYSHLPELQEKFAADNPRLANTISKYRSEYNRGRLIASAPPPKPSLTSFQYDEEGDAINPRFLNPKKLTEEEKKGIRDKYQMYRDAYEEARKS